MDTPSLIQAAATIGVGAISGGITNAVAIWMLFHPHQERRFGWFRLHGAIPKNKARLARSIGKTVGERLLTPEDLAARLSAPAVRQAFDDAMTGVVDRLLEQTHGPLLDTLPPAATEVVEQVVEDLGPRLADRLAEWARTPEFHTTVGGLLTRLRQDVGSHPVGDMLTSETRQALSARVDGWVRDIAEGEEMEAALRRWVSNQLSALEQDPRPLIDRLPPGLLAPLQQAIEDYLPTAIDRLSALLGDPETKATISAALRTAFDGAARQLLLHERILAKLVVKPETFDRLLDGLEFRGFEKFAAEITAPAVRSRLAGALHQALVGLLRMPLGERLARLGPEKRDSLDRTLGDWAVSAARSPATRTSVQHVLERGLDLAGDKTWADLLALIPEERAAELLASAITSEGGRAWIAGSVRDGARRLLQRPVGRPAEWLGPDTTTALRQGISRTAWDWVQAQVPLVVQRLNLPDMVEQKVLGFSTERMEEIVRTVTQRELDLIVRLGYVLGAIVGGIAVLINQAV